MRTTLLVTFSLSCIVTACGGEPGSADFHRMASGDPGAARNGAPNASGTASSTPLPPPTPPSTPPSTPTPPPTPPPPNAETTDAGKPTPPAADASAPAREPLVLIPLHSQYNAAGDWLLSRVANEGAPAYTYTGVNFKVLDVPLASAAMLSFYRCIDVNGTHFQAVTGNCDGVGTFNGLLGFVYRDNPSNGALPIYRCIAPSGRAIVTTVRLADCTLGGFIVQGSAGDFGYAFSREFVAPQ